MNTAFWDNLHVNVFSKVALRNKCWLSVQFMWVVGRNCEAQ